jgi:PadR family transcriptional regulator, regulatory protein PadR
MNDDELWLTQLRKGSLGLCMLALLANQERYGYQIAQSLTESAGLAVSEGTIYPLLSRLQREGLVVSEWRESPAGPPRKYYSLTDKGHKTLEAQTRLWQQFSQAVDDILKEATNGKQGS